ncbi:MAG: hypothetical protein PHR22_04135 [Candidatus Omnitrophica bacterium]|nr:hypothetical protein [Candidatus Omnitrophota bacterium]
MRKLLYFAVMAAALVMLVPAGVRAAEKSGTPVNLQNPGFEADSENPWYWWGDAGTGTYGVSTYKHSGAKSVEIVADRRDYTTVGILQDFVCAPGDEVTASAWVMSPEASPLTNSDAFVRIEFWGADVINPTIALESPHLTGSFNSWTESSVTGKVPEGTTKAKVGLFIWNPGTGHSGTVYFDDVVVTKK